MNRQMYKWIFVLCCCVGAFCGTTAQTADDDVMTDYLCGELVKGLEMDSATAEKFVPIYKRNRAELEIAKKAIKQKIDDYGGEQNLDYEQTAQVQKVLEEIQSKYNAEYTALLSYDTVRKLRRLEYEKTVEFHP